MREVETVQPLAHPPTFGGLFILPGAMTMANDIDFPASCGGQARWTNTAVSVVGLVSSHTMGVHG
jgi:hypothetical protein